MEDRMSDEVNKDNLISKPFCRVEPKPRQPITKSEFCKCIARKYPSIDITTIDQAYDIVFETLSEVVYSDPKARVYLPNIGVIFTAVVPANFLKKLPERLRIRLSCKPFQNKKLEDD